MVNHLQCQICCSHPLESLGECLSGLLAFDPDSWEPEVGHLIKVHTISTHVYEGSQYCPPASGSQLAQIQPRVLKYCPDDPP